MNNEIHKRRKALNKAAQKREIRGSLEPVTEQAEDNRPAEIIYIPKRAELGTIPKPYCYEDACNLVECIGIDAWKTAGYYARLRMLKARG